MVKPGLYISSGAGTKALSLTNADEWARILGLEDVRRNQSVETIAAEVAWVYVALAARRRIIGELLDVAQWQDTSGDEVEQMPFTWDWRVDLPRIDTSLQKRSVAYLFKLRRGDPLTGPLVGLKWLNPTTIEPNPDSIDPTEGYTEYIRQTPRERIIIPAQNMIRVWLPGDAELAPEPSALYALSRPAQILLGVEQVSDAFYDNGALPVTLVNVPSQYSGDATQIQRLQDRFRRLFNAGSDAMRTENRVAAFPEGVTFHQLSFKPGELGMGELSEAMIDTILAACEVPKTQVSRTGGGNQLDTVKDNDKRSFIVGMGQRLNVNILPAINNDPDIQALGLQLMVDVNGHTDMADDEQAKSAALINYVNAGFTPQAAAKLLNIDIDDFPDGMEVFRATVAAPEPVTSGGPGPLDPNATRSWSWMKQDEARQLRSWVKRRKGEWFELADFKTNHLSPAEKGIIAMEVASAKDAPFRGHADDWTDYP